MTGTGRLLWLGGGVLVLGVFASPGGIFGRLPAETKTDRKANATARAVVDSLCTYFKTDPRTKRLIEYQDECRPILAQAVNIALDPKIQKVGDSVAGNGGWVLVKGGGMVAMFKITAPQLLPADFAGFMTIVKDTASARPARR
jgi:hypothetical protein